MDEPVVAFEIGRMLVGDHPALFYLEIVVRTAVIYGYTLALIRWIGGRSVAQLSMVDMLLVIALGSAVGDAMFYPEVPVLAAMAVITVVVGINKGLDTLVERFDRARSLIDGSTIAVVRGGRILNDGLRHRDLSSQEIKGMLRVAGVANLGQVEHAFLEAGGGLSVFRREHPRPGLALVPPDDVRPPPPMTDPPGQPDAHACCTNCGALRLPASVLPDKPCRDCGRSRWTQATLVRDSEPGLID